MPAPNLLRASGRVNRSAKPECVLSRRIVPQSLIPSVLGPGAACVQGKRRLGRPSVESLNAMREALAAGAGENGRTLTTELEGRGSRAPFASH
jgi:hypothetical protein